MPVTINGSGLASGVTSVPNLATFPAGPRLANVNMPVGSVLQVVSATKTDTFSTTSTTYVDVTGLSVSITPTSTSSKIVVSFMFNGGVDTSSQGIILQLVRNSTPICVGDAVGSRPSCTASIGVGSTYSVEAFSGSYLDSPATTSATTYKIQMIANAGVTAYVNRSVTDRNTSLYDPRTASTITVMEIAG